MPSVILIVGTFLLVWPLYASAQGTRFGPSQQNEVLVAWLKDQIGEAQKIVQAESIVYFHQEYQHWTKMDMSLDHITYDVELPPAPENPPQGIVTFTCKVRESHFLKSEAEAAAASTEDTVPDTALCRSTYEFRDGSWIFANGEIYSRNPEWDAVSTEKREGFPQAMFYLMKQTPPITHQLEPDTRSANGGPVSEDLSDDPVVDEDGS